MATKEWREQNREKTREHYRRWYLSNAEKEKLRIKFRKQTIIDWFDELKAKLSCSRCSEAHPACLDFHHKNPSLKEGSLTNLVHLGWSKERILAEIARCEVLCSNCHRKLHWKERKKKPPGE